MHRPRVSEDGSAATRARPGEVLLLPRAIQVVHAAIVLTMLPVAADAQPQRRVTLRELTEMALANNPDIVVERESVTLAEQAGLRARGAYDVLLTAEGRVRTRKDPINSILSGAPAGELAPRVTNVVGGAGMSKLFENGASFSGSTTLRREITDNGFSVLSPGYFTELGLDFRQPLLRGRAIDAPRRAIRIAAAERTRSELQLRRTVSDLVAGVERAYWTLVAAERDLDVRRRNVTLAELQRDDTQARIDAGTFPEADLAQPIAEIERRKGEVYASREALARAQQALKALILRAADDPAWDQELVPADSPETERNVPDAASSVRSALDKRPEIAAAMELIAQQDIEIESARDRLKPAVDLVASYTMRGLAGGENPDINPPFPIPLVVPDAISGGLFQSYATLFEQKFSDAGAGIQVSVPLGNRTAHADLASAEAVKRQAASLVDSARLHVTAEVRNAIAAIAAASERVDAARAGREAAEVQLQAELDRFEAGPHDQFSRPDAAERSGNRQADRDRRSRGLPSRPHRVRARHRHPARRPRHRDRAAGEEVMKRPAARSLYALVITTGTALALVACEKDDPNAPIVLNGRVEATLVDLAPKVPGRVIDVKVVEGDRVKAGDLLVSLDLGDTALAVERDRYAAEAAAARVSRSGSRQPPRRDRSGRSRRVRQARRRRAGRKGTGTAGESAVEEGRHAAEPGTRQNGSGAGPGCREVERRAPATDASRDSATIRRSHARFDVDRARTVVKQSEVVVKEAEIRAPADAVVINRMAEPGLLLAPGQPGLTLAFTNRLYIQTFIPEQQLGLVRQGLAAEVRVDSYPGRTFPARVAEISPDAEFTPKQVETREERVNLVYAAKVDLDAGWNVPLVPGQPAEVVIKREPPASAPAPPK